MNNIVIIISSLAYLALLFGIAYYTEKRAVSKRSIINNGYVYALSLAVYCTAWTYYGSVGRASTKGLDFITIYLGPTIAAALFWPILRKLIRIAKSQRITSIADLISSRYGKNFSLAALVTILCIIGIIPYIALQLKAISSSIHIITGSLSQLPENWKFWNDDTFYITGILVIFIIIFGTRSVDASEKHEGLVAAIAFESLIKLIAFLAVGVFVVFFIFNGFGDIFQQAYAHQELKKLFTIEPSSSYASWAGLMLVSMLAIFFLPRQFQVSVTENIQEKHIDKAVWVFPLYLLLINIFVLPIALAGKLIFIDQAVDADTYVLAFPLHFNASALSLFVYIGGFSAATSMIIVETIALSTMACNNLVMPILLSLKQFKTERNNHLSKNIILIRRISIFIILALAYIYDKTVAQHLALVSIGLVSFVAVAQFAPAVIGGIYWKGASKTGAIVGIIVGFIIWFFTLVVPTLISPGILPSSIMSEGLFGISFLKPFSLLGHQGMDSIAHATFWSLFANVGSFVFFSLYSKQTAQEIYQAEIFVDIAKHANDSERESIWKGIAYLPDLKSLLKTFIGEERSTRLLTNFANKHKISLEDRRADPRLVTFSEKILSGVIGSASARIMVGSITKEEELKIDEVLNILRESQQIIELNKELKKKSNELQKASNQLISINEQLKNMDRNKDEFLYTVTHELRTPITSIRAMSEIVHDHQDMPEEQKQHFLSSIIKETERLSRLISQVLTLEKYESGKQKLNLSSVHLNQLILDTINAVKTLAAEKNLNIKLKIPNSMFIAKCDEDLILQVMNNLLANAIKFSNTNQDIIVSLNTNYNEIEIAVQDFGKGIDPLLHKSIFDKFFQAKNQTLRKPEGTGLGLAICKKIIDLHGGTISVESELDKGAKFIFSLPLQ
ncbi:MAG TPA: sensor histidine kinase [Saprospiraceae bacterium]|nr:sensor histidine kinase [Saprospiraceae bacterium]